MRWNESVKGERLIIEGKEDGKGRKGDGEKAKVRESEE